MKYNASWKKAYAETVEYAVIAALEAVGEGGQFSLQEFCDGYGFKKTYNLRRRMEELVQRGIVARAERYLENGHLGYGFFRPSTYEPLPWTDLSADHGLPFGGYPAESSEFGGDS